MASIFFVKSSKNNGLGAWYIKYQQAVKGKKKQIKLNLTKHHGVTTEAEAIEFKKAQEVQESFGLSVVAKKETPFESYANRVKDIKGKKYPASRERRDQIIDQYLIPFFAGRSLESITKADCNDYEADRVCDGVKRSTIEKEISTLKAICAMAYDEEIIDRNRIKSFKVTEGADSAPPVWFDEELTDIFQLPKYNHWWMLVTNTGLRLSEFIMLKREWIGQDEMKILSSEECRTKSKKWREVPLSEQAQEALEMFEKTESGNLIDWPFTSKALSNRFRRQIRAKGIKKGHFHSLRHSFAAHHVMGGTDIRTLQLLMGHANVETTEKYAHISKKHLKGIQLILPR